jgi:hypothetical protein
MTPALIQQRCWNHDTREAVCRCPECGRSYCRECVTEHEARLLCSACLKVVAGDARRGRDRGVLRSVKLAPTAMLVGGLALAWCIFFAAGETLIWISSRLEQTSWQQPR